VQAADLPLFFVRSVGSDVGPGTQAEAIFPLIIGLKYAFNEQGGVPTYVADEHYTSTTYDCRDERTLRPEPKCIRRLSHALDMVR